MNEESKKQILLIAPDLLAESIGLQLINDKKDLEIVLTQEDLSRQPSLVLFCLDNTELPTTIKYEIQKLKSRWEPSPILVILPEEINLSKSDLLSFETEGIIQGPNLKRINDAVHTVINGGRIIQIKEKDKSYSSNYSDSYGIGQLLLLSGLSQINKDLEKIDLILETSISNPLLLFLILGRRRELNTAKELLNWLWGPLKISIKPLPTNKLGSEHYLDKYETDISIESTTSLGILSTIINRITSSLENDLANSTNDLLSLYSLNDIRRLKLLRALISQLDLIIHKMHDEGIDEQNLASFWESHYIDIRKQALRDSIGSYSRLIKAGKEVPIIDTIVSLSKLDLRDDELPSMKNILNPFILNKPINVSDKYIELEDPRALLHIEFQILNWLIRTADLISAEIIQICSSWPELRKYFLTPNLISTREIERYRNLINSKSRINNIFKRPIRLYESKRMFFYLKDGAINITAITETRDEELKQLSWIQSQVALAIEARDALSPQLQIIVQYFGDLIVLILTKVIGRSIGLIGKGIAQGMGKTISKKQVTKPLSKNPYD